MNKDLELTYLKQLAAGSTEAFDILYLQYSPKVKCFLGGFLKNSEEASDMTQDVFFKIWNNRGAMVEVESFNAYLFRMARNMIYDYYEHHLVIEGYLQKQSERSTYTDLIEEELYAKELGILLDIVVEKMPPQQKNIFRMSRHQGLSNDEIAGRLGISKRTVENHITLALRELRKVIYNLILFF